MVDPLFAQIESKQCYWQYIDIDNRTMTHCIQFLRFFKFRIFRTHGENFNNFC